MSEQADFKRRVADVIEKHINFRSVSFQSPEDYNKDRDQAAAEIVAMVEKAIGENEPYYGEDKNFLGQGLLQKESRNKLRYDIRRALGLVKKEGK